MDSNDENYESGNETNSVSTDTRNDAVSIKSERIQKKPTNVVFVSPNELDDWELGENRKSSKRTYKPKKSVPKPKPIKTPAPVKSNKKKKTGVRKKPKKDSNPWSSDQDEEEELGLDNEVSDDEYFRRLEESQNDATAGIIDNQQNNEDDEDDIQTGMKLGETESLDCDADDYYDDVVQDDDYYVKIFDSSNFELFNYITAARDASLDMDDKSKPQIIFPESSHDLMCPNDKILQLLSIYETIIQYNIMLKISPFKLEDFIAAMVLNENSNLLSELHMSLLKLLLRDDELTNTQLCAPDQKDAVNFAFYLMDAMTWPELLKLYVASLEHKVSSGVVVVSNYPFVMLDQRIAVLSFLLDQIIFNCNIFRQEISREECVVHEDFCRVCHEQGKVICCETCPAVYHFYCLTPKLPALPDTIWLCPICRRHQIDGLRDCNFDAEKAIVEHKKTPLGTDRFGNTYWFVARRLIVEPRNDNIDNLLTSEHHEKVNYGPDYTQVLYYSSWSSVEKLRTQLSRDWEEELCVVFDGLVDEIRKSMQVTLNLTVRGLQKVRSEVKDIKVKSVLLSECSKNSDEKERVLNAELSDLTSSLVNVDDEEPVQNCALKTLSGQQVGLLEDNDGLLVRNIDSNAIRVRLSAKTISNQVDEVASRYNFHMKDFQIYDKYNGVVFYRLGDEGDWRFYKNLYVSDTNAVSKLIHQEEKDKRRVLGNKFSINECNDFQWFISKAKNRSNWPSDKICQKRKPVNDYFGGPLSMLQCIRLTLQNIEAQIFSSLTCPSWRHERKVWLVNIQRTRNAANLAEFVSTFEKALRPTIFKKSWNSLLGFLELDRVTVAEKEEDKKIKMLEKRANKNLEVESTKTCNPGFLKHAIYKTKGEDYRRNGGDGWTWLNSTILYNTMDLCLQPAPEPSCSINDEDYKNLLITGEDMESASLIKDIVSNETDFSNDNLLQIREKELVMYEKVSSLTESKNRLTQLEDKKEEYLAKKKLLDEKLATLYNSLKSSNSTSSAGRKRTFPFGNMSLQEKRSRFGLGGDSISQYDGVNSGNDDDDDDADLDDDKYNDVSSSQPGSLVSNIPPPIVSGAGMKPIIINNAGTASRVCVVNLPPGSQFQQGAMGNRLILNSSRMPTPMTTTTAASSTPAIGLQPRPNTQFIRLPNMYIQPQQININPNMLAARPMMNPTTIRLQSDVNATRNNAGAAQVQPQFMYVNNIANIGGANPQIRFVNNLQVQQNPKQFQRLILPNMTDANLAGIPIRAPINANTTMPNLLPQNVTKPNTNQVIRQRTHQAITNRVSPNVAAINFKQQEEYMKKMNEINDVANQLLELAYELDDLDQEINKMKFQCQQLNTEISTNHHIYPYELKLQQPKHCVAIINEGISDNKTIDETNVPIPPPKPAFKDSYQFKNVHFKNDKQPSCYSLFLHNPENLRNFFLSERCNDISGYETEKKRFNMVVWPYPTARPSFSAVWRYQVARVMQSESVFETVSYEKIKQEVENSSDKLEDSQSTLLTGATDSCLINQTDGNNNGSAFMSTANNGVINGYGASGLAALALQLKMLWYSLRWDDMLTNWQDNEGVVSLVELAQDTLPNGDILERRIIKWRPLDSSYSRLQFLTTVCISSPSSSSSITMNFLGGGNSNHNSSLNMVKNNVSSDDTSNSNKRSSKRARKKTVSMYADSEYFTDDGEIDSDDSDPSFVPGMVGSNVRTPKSRGGRRRKGGGGDDDLSSSGTMHQEKNYYSEWKFEDEIDMWEIRDFLMRNQWNRRHIQLPKVYLSDVMNGLVSKEIFTRPIEPVRSITSSLTPGIIQSLQRQSALQVPISNIQYNPSQSQPVMLNNQLQSLPPPISTPTTFSSVPTTTQLASALNTSITQPNSTLSVVEPKQIPIAPAPTEPSNITNSSSGKLIIESSANAVTAVNPNSTLASIIPKTSTVSTIPKPLSDIRDSRPSRTAMSSVVQQIPEASLKLNNISINLPLDQASKFMSNFTDMPQKSGGRGRGRGRPPLSKYPSSPDVDSVPNEADMYQMSSDDDDEIDDCSFNKYEDLKVDVEEAANDVLERIKNTKEAFQNQVINETLLNLELSRQEEILQKENLLQQPAQNIAPVQKVATQNSTKTSSKSNQRKNSDDEQTDPETESLKNKKMSKSITPKSTPSKSTPVKSTLIESTPVKSTPVESSPVKSSPIKSYLVKSSPMKSTLIESSPIKSTLIESSPIKSTLIESTPVKSIPVKSSPIKSSPVKSSPIKSSPVKSSPIKSSPVKSSPVKSNSIDIVSNNQLKRPPQLVSDIFDDDDEDDEDMDSNDSPSFSTDNEKDSHLLEKQFKGISSTEQMLISENKVNKKSKSKETTTSNVNKQMKTTSSATNMSANNALKTNDSINPSPAKKRKKNNDVINVQKENIKQKNSKQARREDVQLFCHCKKPYDEKRNYIGCDYCNNWYHFECVNMDHEKAGKITQYCCSTCAQISTNTVAKTSNASMKSKILPSTNTSKREAAQARKPIVDKSDDDEDEDEDEDDEDNEYEEDENAVYCICREKYNSHKMYIACDYCDEWYHPKCVGMTDSEANKIEGKYKCPRCRGIPDKPQNTKKSKSTKSTSNKSNSINLSLNIDDHVKRRLFDLINKIFKHEDAISIVKNGKKDSRYIQIVKNPMDLNTVKSYLERNKYKTLGSFKLDIQKIFTGCSSYLDSTSDDYESVKNLESIFIKELKYI